MSSIEISIIFPVYNSEKYLSEAINSIQRQTIKDFEVIAINDGSTDSSLSLLTEVANKDSRFKIINQENKGLSSARNTGIHNSNGKWICFIDSDDWMDPKTLEKWLDYAQKNDADFLVGNGFRFRGDDINNECERKPILKKQQWGNILSGKEWIEKCVSQKEWPHFVWLQLIRRDVITANGLMFVDGIAHEDILWTTNLSLNASRIVFYQEPLYGYRINELSITNSNSIKTLENRACSYLYIIKRLSDSSELIDDKKLKKSLLLQANREGGHFIGILRKKITDHKVKRELAIKFLTNGTALVMLKGMVNMSTFWLSIRCIFICISYTLIK